jgi:hypothetical protein
MEIADRYLPGMGYGYISVTSEGKDFMSSRKIGNILAPGTIYWGTMN